MGTKKNYDRVTWTLVGRDRYFHMKIMFCGECGKTFPRGSHKHPATTPMYVREERAFYYRGDDEVEFYCQPCGDRTRDREQNPPKTPQGKKGPRL